MPAGKLSTPSAFPSPSRDYRSASDGTAEAASPRTSIPLSGPGQGERGGESGGSAFFKSEEWRERRLFVILAAGSAVSQRRGAVETSQRGLCFFVFSSGVVTSPPVLSGVQAAGSGNGRVSAEASCFVHLLMRAA